MPNKKSKYYQAFKQSNLYKALQQQALADLRSEAEKQAAPDRAGISEQPRRSKANKAKKKGKKQNRSK